MVDERRPFDPTKHLVAIKFRGSSVPRSYLPVAARIMWLRSLYPNAVIETWPITDEVGVRSTWGARVTLPDGGAATGYGSRQAADNRGDYYESGETRALGRALAHLGIATEYINPDEMDEGRDDDGAYQPVDSGRPVDQSALTGRQPAGAYGGPDVATERQVKAIYAIGRAGRLSDADIARRAQEAYGAPPEQLQRRDASNFIDLLKQEMAGQAAGQ